MSGFWTSFNQIFLTMPEYIRDFTETKPLLNVGRSVFGAIGKPEWADHLASVDDNEVFAEVDRLVRQARGIASAVPPDPEEADPKKLASELRSEIKSKRKEARRYADTRLLADAQRKQAKQIAAELLAVDKRNIDEMKAAIAATADPLHELGRLALEATLKKDQSFTPQVRARLEELVRELSSPDAEKPLVMLDLVEGTRKILGYKVRLTPVEFGELLARAPARASSATDEAMQDALEKLNKRLRDVRRPKFEDEEAGEVETTLRLLMKEHGPLVSREATVVACKELSTDGRKVEPKQLIVAINVLAYKDSVWDLVVAGRQFNPEFIVNINALGIVCFQVLISFLMARFHRFTTMIVGMMVAAVGIGLSSMAGGEGMLGAGGLIWVVAGAILIFSFGEMMASPTSQEYVGRIAPRDKVALYMGYYFVAIALGNLFGGILSGQLYGKLARDMQRPDLMWTVFGAIMLATAIVFMLYNKFAMPKEGAQMLTGENASA
jgi:hypothetical protein